MVRGIVKERSVADHNAIGAPSAAKRVRARQARATGLMTPRGSPGWSTSDLRFRPGDGDPLLSRASSPRRARSDPPNIVTIDLEASLESVHVY